MKHTLATNTIEGLIPHKVIVLDEVPVFLPVKLDLRTKLNGKKAVDMLKDSKTSEYLPVPLRTESGYIYAWPGGGDFV